MLCDKLCTFNCMCVSDTVNCSLIVGSNTEDDFIRFETCVRNLCDDICAINCGWFYKLYFFFKSSAVWKVMSVLRKQSANRLTPSWQALFWPSVAMSNLNCPPQNHSWILIRFVREWNSLLHGSPKWVVLCGVLSCFYIYCHLSSFHLLTWTVLCRVKPGNEANVSLFCKYRLYFLLL
jgi:hypothetical protein